MTKPKFIVYDAGSGIYEIAKYNPSVTWHNDSDVIACYNYPEALHEKERNEERAYKFRNCVDLYN
jgi:hypothetical protein